MSICCRTRPAKPWTWWRAPAWRSSTRSRRFAISGPWCVPKAISIGCSTMSRNGRGWSSTRSSIPRSVAISSASCRQRKLHAVPVLDPVIDALAALSGEQAQGRAGRQHALDAAYFARVDAIQFTIAHDDGVGTRELGGSGYRPRRRVAQLEDADQHLSCQSRLQGREHPARARIAAAGEPVLASASR